jgi:glycosyltransferase involved in cell wall biosynthesis
MEPLTLIVPTFNEAETIGGVIREIPVAYRLDIIVADVGSTDGTRAVVQAAGARVIDVGRGYRRACAGGAAAAHTASMAIAFMDGDGADPGDLIGEIARPVLDGTYDFARHPARAVSASLARCCGTGLCRPGRRIWHRGTLRCEVHRHVRLSGDQPRCTPRPGDAGNDQWLEYRDADEGGVDRPAYPGSATAVPVSRWGQFEGRWLIARYAPSGQSHRCDLLSG